MLHLCNYTGLTDCPLVQSNHHHRKSQEAKDCWSLCRLNPIPSPNVRPSSPNHKQDSCLWTGAIIYPSLCQAALAGAAGDEGLSVYLIPQQGLWVHGRDKMLRSLAAANQAAL
ncbi:unnamed protein product [Pleuronectes platessa]|uniref:Uncharacterized protein n=1 Tax=Pleuronectes platessa TaxID=8262 RepID=A0A9N7ZBF0_PLEPL|nr:unnamed protein product [Pleuronectes platessa]